MNVFVKHRIWMSVLVVSLVGVLLAGCTSKPATTSAPAPAAAKPAAKAIKLRYSGGLPPDHHVTKEQKWFAEEVGKRTNGQVTVEAYIGGELYNHEQVVNAVSSGAIEMGLTASGMFQGAIFGYYNYFFLLENLSQLEKGKEQMMTKVFAPQLEKLKCKPLHWFAYGDQGLSARKSLGDPKDIKGLLIRGQQQETITSLKALGAVPVAIASAEVYDALAKKSIDGAISGWTTFSSRKYYEVVNNFTGPFNDSPWFAFMNLSVWNGLPKDIQNTILEISKETEKMTFATGIDEDKNAIEFLKTKGNVVILSAEQRKAWLDAARPTYDVWLAECDKAGTGNEARELMKILDAAR